MPKTTEQMKATTNEMNTTMGGMYANMETLLELSRSKEAEATRAEKFEAVLSKKKDIGEKITSAAVFYKSFEFQLATLKEKSRLADRMDGFRLDAVNEFTRRMSDLYRKIKPAKMSPTKDRNNDNAFYAFAAALHMNHHFQEQISHDNNLKTVSFLDIIQDALRKERDGEYLKEYEDVLLTGMNREMIVELLKARVDIAAAIAFSYMTDKREMGIKAKGKGLLFKLSGGRLGSIQVPMTLNEANESTRRSTIQTLDAAIKVKRFLGEIGVEKELEKYLRSAYQNLTFSGSDDQTQGNKELNEIEFLVKEILD